MPQERAPGLSGKLIYPIVILGCFMFLLLGMHREPRIFHSRDFKQPYASARCVLKHCDPYSEADTEAQFVAAHGPDNDPLVFVPYSALYPPPSLLLLTPIAALPYPVAQPVWMCLIGVLFSLAALAVANLCIAYGKLIPVVGLALMLTFSDELMTLGQISGVAIALLVIGLWLVLSGRSFASGVCLALAVCLKPHDVVFFFPYFLIAGRTWRRSLTWTIALSGLITIVALGWFASSPATAHWLTSLRASLAGNSGSGSVNDPAPTNLMAEPIMNLQTVFSVFRNSRPFYSAAAYLVTLILYVALFYAVLRTEASRARHLIAIAALACITLMPIYHRQYDTRLLILIFPAIALLFSLRRYGWAIAAMVFAVVDYLAQVVQLMHQLALGASLAQNGPIRFLLAFRSIQLGNLGLAILFVAVLVGMTRAAGKSLPPAES